MNHKLEKKIRRALKAPVPVSEDHLEATKKAVYGLYAGRRQRQKISFPAFLLAQVRFCGVWVWLLQGGALPVRSANRSHKPAGHQPLYQVSYG